MASQETVDISVILINWRMSSDLTLCLESIKQHEHQCSLEIILINKPSGDGTEELIRDKYPNVRIFQHSTFGFATMRNRGLRESRGKYCLILDTDVEILEGCFDALVAFMNRHPRVGGCGGHTTRLDGKIEYNVKRFYNFATVLARRSPLDRYWPNNPWNRHHQMMDKDHDHPFEGDWMAGACFCIRRKVIQEVGYFDESMHYFEDVDWCWRAKASGWIIAFNPYARIIHKVQGLSKKGFNRNTAIHLASGLRFWFKLQLQAMNWTRPKRTKESRATAFKVLSEPIPRVEGAPDLSVVVINLNGKKLLRDCLVSLRESTPRHKLEVFVVDNGSTDGSPEMTEEEFPEVKLIRNTRNLGFTKANNQGILRSSGRYVMMLNNDTRVLPGAFSDAIDYLDEEPEIGAAGLKLLNEDGSVQLSCRRFPSFTQALFSRYSLLTRLFPNNRFSRSYLMTDEGHDRVRDVDWVSGACLVTRQEVVRAIGALDERFFMYSEDVDYCYRVWQGGWRVTYIPIAEVYHLIGQDTKKVRVRLTFERHRSMYKFYKKHYSQNLMIVDMMTAVMIAIRCGWHLTTAWLETLYQRGKTA